MATKVLIVDDSIQSRFYMKASMCESENFEIIHEIECANHAVTYCGSNKVDMILMNVCTADGACGIQATKRIKEKYPHIKIIVVTAIPEHSFIEKAKAAGCEGFWYKENPLKDLKNLIDRVMNGEKIFPDKTPIIEVGFSDSASFTNREFEVIKLKAKGYTNAYISKELNITERTVKFHITRMLNKTGYETTGQLIYELLSKNVIHPDF